MDRPEFHVATPLHRALQDRIHVEKLRPAVKPQVNVVVIDSNVAKRIARALR
jgi:hypothetical protein